MRGSAETSRHRIAETRRCFTYATCYSAFCILWVLVPARAQSGGAYVIKKSTIDGGGGTATGGTYHVAGTVGQHDAPDLTGGNYVLNGGFWNKRQPSEAIPTVSEWGIAALTLLVLTAGTLVLRGQATPVITGVGQSPKPRE